MIWRTIRLELTSDSFPQGCASRAYILRLPLREDETIDEEALKREPSKATVRRFWASEPDRFGHIASRDGDFGFEWHGCSNHPASRLAVPFKLNDTVSVQEPDGEHLSFRVTDIR